EVIIGNHRADIVTRDGAVVELQHSTISPQEIAEREAHYGRMWWIFDATAPSLAGRLELRPRDGYYTFRWKHPRTSISWCERPVLLDLDGEHLLSVRKIYVSGRCGGWGHLVHADQVRGWLGRPSAEEH